METAGACFERCLGQAPAEVLMLGQLEASARCIVAQSRKSPADDSWSSGHGFKPQWPPWHRATRLQGISQPSKSMTMKPISDRRSFLQTAAVAATAVAAGGPLVNAWAQTKWPAKPIRIIVAFPPGGLTDALARSYGEHLSLSLIHI